MTQNELASLADDWISYRHAPEGSPEREKYSWATDLYDLEYHEPETLWLLILEIHRRDKSVAVQQVLSAGPIENLLAIHGESFIERVEAEARKDPAFAKVLGGVWKNRMSDAIWARLQAVWDRRGWDGIPELTERTYLTVQAHSGFRRALSADEASVVHVSPFIRLKISTAMTQ